MPAKVQYRPAADQRVHVCVLKLFWLNLQLLSQEGGELAIELREKVGGLGLQKFTLVFIIRSSFRYKSCLFECGSVQDLKVPSRLKCANDPSVAFLAGETRKMVYFRSREV